MTLEIAPLDAARRELAHRVLARRRLLTFTQKINPRYLPGWVHEDICRRLERFSREVEEGKSPRLMLLMPPRHGKACAVGTVVPTPVGFRAIETLRPGDEVFGRDGRPTRVVAVSPVWEDRELYEVVSDDGASVVVDAEHEWTVRLCRKRQVFKTKTTKYLAERSSPRNPTLMTYSAVEFPEKELPIHPYVLGVWLGDGCSAHATITQGEQDYDFIRTEVERCGHFTSDRATAGTFGVADIQPHLRDLGVLRAKHIPEMYRTASADQRRALLQGLIDTDGHVAPDGQVEFCSTNEELARHVLQMVRSLGVKASLVHGDATLNGQFISRKYRVMFYMSGAARLPRKAARCRDNGRTPHRFLTFRPAGRGNTVCIQVEAEDHQYLVGHGFLLTHNSELASRMFPAWHLGRCPDHEFIACSYNVSLAMSFSRKVKEVIQDPVYEAIFDTRLHPDFQAAEEWAIKGHRGGYVAAGVGGGITGKGAHCLAPQTLVRTEVGPLAIERLYQLKSLPRVETPFGYKRVLAATKRPAPQLYTLRFASGAVLRATGEHPVYLPDRSKYVQVKELYGQAVGGGGSEVRVVRASVPTPPLRPREVCTAGVDGVLLRQGLQSGTPRGEEREALRDVRQAGRSGGEEPGSPVLQSEVQAQPGAASAEVLPSMRRGVSAETFHAGLLRGDLREYGAHDPYAWGGELELPHGQRIRVLVRPDAPIDPGAGQGLRGVLGEEGFALPPHQRGPQRQRPGEPGDAVRGAPHGAPQICTDTLLVVERDGEGADFVYDLQVEDAGCFFAGDVLVGNCLLIDDPVKNAEEANSADLREKLWEWYTSTAYTRLAPGGGVLVIQTCWHDDDLAGKLQNAMRSDDEADTFEVIKYPAIAEFDEYLDPDTDLIVDAPPEGHPELTPLRLKGEPLHPARYDLRRLNQIRRTLPTQWWSALYQQNPVPDEGVYFTKDMFRRGPAPRTSECYVSVAFDFAISEKQQNDYTVGTVTLLDSDDVLHFVDRVRFKSADADFICKAIVSLCKKWHNPSIQLGLEDGQIYRAISGPLKREMARQRVYPSMQLLKPITDKQARARTLQGRMQQGLVSFSDEAEWYDSMRTEMLRFPSGVNDDQVDSAAWNAIMVAGRQPPKKQQARPMKSWKDRLQGVGDGTHMAA